MISAVAHARSAGLTSNRSGMRFRLHQVRRHLLRLDAAAVRERALKSSG